MEQLSWKDGCFEVWRGESGGWIWLTEVYNNHEGSV